jgi:hypothetical protein
MKKSIYQVATFLQDEGSARTISEVISLLTERIGKAAAEDKLSNLTTSLYDQGYIDGIRAGAQLIRLLAGDADTIETTA